MKKIEKVEKKLEKWKRLRKWKKVEDKTIQAVPSSEKAKHISC